MPVTELPLGLPGRVFRSPMPFGQYDLHGEVYDRLALIGFQGRGLEEVAQPDFCHNLFLEALIFQWAQKYVTILGQQGSIRPRNPIRAYNLTVMEHLHKVLTFPYCDFIKYVCGPADDTP